MNDKGRGSGRRLTGTSIQELGQLSQNAVFLTTPAGPLHVVWSHSGNVHLNVPPVSHRAGWEVERRTRAPLNLHPCSDR